MAAGWRFPGRQRLELFTSSALAAGLIPLLDSKEEDDEGKAKGRVWQTHVPFISMGMCKAGCQPYRL